MLTVVTIARNDCAGLQKTLASVSSQDIELEHIVIDGDSSDGSMELLTAVDRPRFSYVSEPDRGRYHAMKKGVGMATGDVIWFMHAGDTFASPSSARLGYQALEATSANWGYGLSRVHRGGETIEVRGAVPFRLTRFLVGKDTIPHQAVFMRASFLRDIGGYGESFGLAEDQRLLMGAVLREHPTVIPEILCDFDGDGAGSMRRARDHYGDFWRARREYQIRIANSYIADGLLTAYIILRTRVGRAANGRRRSK